MKYIVHCTWEVYGIMEIEAESGMEATDIAYEEPLPDGDYIDGSFKVEEVERMEIEEEPSKDDAVKSLIKGCS